MIWDQDFGFYSESCFLSLINGHGVGLIHRKEGEVNIFNLSHFRDILGVTGDVNASAVNIQYIAVAVSFGVEFLSSGSGVIIRNTLERYAVGKIHFLIVCHDCAFAKLFFGSGIKDDLG